MQSKPPITETHWSQCESVIRRFEDAWHDRARPDVESFLPTETPHQTRLLVELIHVDLEFRIRAGEAARVEEYLARFPALSSAEHKFDLIRAEYALRRRLGPVALDEFERRFPEHSDELRGLLSDGGEAGPLTPTRPAGSAGVPLTVTPVVPGYEVQGELGRGGMGVVYQARDVILNRTVAIKTLASVPGAESCARFAREAEAIAKLDHPGIVPVYEVGEWRAGAGVPPVPFFVMKYYPGGSLDAAAAGPGTDPAAQARAVEAIARAVHHAHERGILHRDLKPSNILLDEAGRPHVADFGLAGRVGPEGPLSLTGAVMGTPAYMAPEQAVAPGQVTTAADVYGIGAILYHQLTGRPPVAASTPLATLEMLANTAPARPSAVNPAVPRDLETVCLKCLDKDPARRYASAAEVADDLERWRTGRPVLARPTATWEHVWRWVRRHPLVGVMTAVTAAALVVAFVSLSESNARIREKERETREAYLRECAMRYKLEESVRREQQSLYTERVASAGRLYASNQLPQAWDLLDPCPDHLRRWEWKYLDALRHAGPVMVGRHENWVRSAAFLADDRVATGDELGVVRVWNADGTPGRTWTTGQGRLVELAAHPTRNWLAAAGRESVVVWDADTGEQLRRLPGTFRVAFSPCGRWAVTSDRTVAWVWSLPDWAPKRELTDHVAEVSAVTFSPDGNRLLTGTRDGTIRSWDVGTGAGGGATWRRPRAITGLAFTGDGAALVEAHSEGVVVADPATGRHRHRVDPTAAGRAFMAVAAAQGWVGVTGAESQVVVWDVARRRAVRVFHGHTARVTALAFSRDGKRLASGGGDLTVRVWDLSRQPGVQTLAEVGGWAGSLAVAPDGSRVAVGPRFNGNPADNRVLVFDATTGRELRRLAGAGNVAFHPDSRRVAAGRADGGVALWDTDTGAELWAAPPTGNAPDGVAGCRPVFSTDGSRLAVWESRGPLRVLDAATGAVVGTIDTGPDIVNAMDFTPDGTRLAVCTPTGLTLWDVRTLTRLRQLNPGWGAHAVAFSPDGRLLASADRDRVIRIRDAATGDPVRMLVAGSSRVSAVSFSPDGRLVTGAWDNSVRVYDVESGRELLTLPGIQSQVMGVAWDKARDRVIALDDAVRVWSPDGR